MGRDIEVTPRAWSVRGEAELTVRGRTLYVWEGIPGESAKVRLVKETRDRGYAVFHGSHHRSPHRVEPPCDRYHVCGGCPLMHVDAAGQRLARRSLVRSALDQAELDDVDVEPVVPSPDGEVDYRWAIELQVGWSDQGRLRVGVPGRRGGLVPIPECLVLAPALRRAMGAIAHHVLHLELAPYDVDADKGVIRAIRLRGSRATGDVVVTLIAGRRTQKLADLAALLVQDAAGIVGVTLHLNDEEGAARFALDDEGNVRVTPLEGRPWIEEQVLDHPVRLQPADAFPANPGAADALARGVLERLPLGPGIPFVELGGGMGGLALGAARITGWALALETTQSTADALREAARAEGLHAEILADEFVEELLLQAGRRLPGEGAVVAVHAGDAGLHASTIDGILALRPSRIALVSCNPRSLARDLSRFRQRGSKVVAVAPYDLFPNTAHVACVALIEGDAPLAEGRRAPRRKVVGRPASEDREG